MVMPGDNVQLEIELITPVAMDKGLRFAIREGGRTVGAGVWNTTVVVLVAIFFFGFYLWGVDRLITLGFEALEKVFR
jgi:hypothetical protein